MSQSLERPSGIGRYGPMAHELTRLGHQVKIYALHPDFSSMPQKKILDGMVQIEYVAPMHIQKRGHQKTYYPAWKLPYVACTAAWRLFMAALHSNADILLICKPHPMNGIAGLLAGWLKQLRIIVDCDDYEAGSGNFQSLLQRWVIAFFEKQIPKRAEAVLTNTDFMRQNLISWGVPSARILYLPNGVERSRFEQTSNEEVAELIHQYGLAGREIVSFIGSLSLVNHPVNLLLDAFVIVKKKLPDACLLIVGGGEDFERLIQQTKEDGISDSVVFTGFIPPDEIWKYYLMCHTTVDPVYDNEAAKGRSPLKMFESWACGIPFITSDVGDRRYLSGEPPACYLVNPGDPTSLAEAIERILANPEIAENLRQSGYRRVEDFYWDRLVKGINRVFQQTR